MEQVAARSLGGREPAAAAGDPAGAALAAAQLNELLQRRLREVIGPDRFGGLGQLVDWRCGLVRGIDPEALSGRVRALCPRLARPESATALALNSFLPWRDGPGELELAGAGGFAELHFDGRCPTGVRGTPPRVDVIAAGREGVVGATLRVFDYLAPRRAGTAAVSAGYRALQVGPGLAGWAGLLRDAGSFRHADVAGLAKLALGLGRIFGRRPVRLLYLFLEPQGGAGPPAVAAHRAELGLVARRVAGGDVAFSACSLHELWDRWCARDTPAWARGVAAELAHRYAVAMPG